MNARITKWKTSGLLLIEPWNDRLGDSTCAKTSFGNSAVLWDGPLGFRILPLETLAGVWVVTSIGTTVEGRSRPSFFVDVFRDLGVKMPKDYKIVGLLYHNHKGSSRLEGIMKTESKKWQ